MGVNLAFTYDSDFSNMLESDCPQKTSKVIHKAFIEVNEEGSEAAAVTMDFRMMLKKRHYIPEFHATQPFFYWIWDGKHILFAGTFVNAPNDN